MGGNVEIVGRQRRDPGAVDERPFRRDAPAFELAVLTAFQLPPVRRIGAALVAEIAGARPHSDLPAIDRDRDVGGPVGRRPRHFGGHFQRKFERDDRLVDEARIVGKLILDKAAGEPHQSRVHPVGVEEGAGDVEQPDNALRRAQPARRADLAARIKPDRHRDFDHVGLSPGGIVADHDEQFVKSGEAKLLIAFAALARLGSNQARRFENLQIGRNSRLGQVERRGDFIDVGARLAMQQPQDADAGRRRQAAQHVRALLGIDDQKIPRHALLRPCSPRPTMYQLFRYFKSGGRMRPPRRRPSGAIHVRSFL